MRSPAKNAEDKFEGRDGKDSRLPVDFDSVYANDMDLFDYAVTTDADYQSGAPPNWEEVDRTDSYVLWKRNGSTPEDRHVLLEGTEAGARADCASPEIRILLASPGRASLFPDAAIGPKSAWKESSVLGTGESASQPLELAPGSWEIKVVTQDGTVVAKTAFTVGG